MIRRWFKDTFILEKRSYTDVEGVEPFIEYGVVKGFMQPVTGRLSMTNSKEAGEMAMMLYTRVGSDVEAGDRITDVYGRTWIAHFAQKSGITGRGDHEEIAVELVR